MTIYSKNQITAEATAAAVLHSNVNDCCPYPFDTAAGQLFREVFEAANKEAEDPINVGAALDIKHSLDQFEAVAVKSFFAHENSSKAQFATVIRGAAA